MKRLLPIILVHLLFLSSPAFASRHIDFTIHKLGSDRPGNTLLVIGGIQGDEPGGFNAAALLATQYKIKKGSVWVVPNLNFISIIKRSRGVHGDLNRKFAKLGRSDPEFDTISKVKRIILDEQVDLVLNLHDGSGFYRPT
jgi:predicted deacylase